MPPEPRRRVQIAFPPSSSCLLTPSLQSHSNTIHLFLALMMVDISDHSSAHDDAPQHDEMHAHHAGMTPSHDTDKGAAVKAGDLDALRKAVEDAATVSTSLWISYLFLLFYIAIAVGAVTHLDLLLENPVKLPFLGIELPLVAFFFLVPLLFLIMHAYTLVHFVMLGRKLA